MIDCWTHNLSSLFETTQWLSPLVIISKIKIKIMHLCGLPKTEFTNQEISIPITFCGLSIGYSGQT
jgi:hypothetical protein